MQTTTVEHLLEYQADQIELVLAATGSRPGPGGDGYTSLGPLQLAPDLTVKVARVAALAEELLSGWALTMSGSPGRGRPLRRGARADARTVRLLSLCGNSRVPRQSAILGLDESGLPLLLRLSSPR